MISQGFPTLFQGEIKAKDHYYERVKLLFFDDPQKVVICKVTANLSQSYIEKLIKDFVTSSVSEILVFTAAFQGSQPRMKKIINHVRIMIEEEERALGVNQEKLFVILVHFTPIMLSSYCYPSLYLHGWDHNYLDSICQTYSIELSELDAPTVVIKDWFLRFCLKGSNSNGTDHLIEPLKKILKLSYPIIVSRATFGKDTSMLINKPMDAFEKIKQLSFLLEEFENGAVGEILLRKFQSYWTPRNMNRYVCNAAIKAYSCESRLSLSDSIQHMLQSLFLEFLSYMVSWMNVDYSVDLVLAESDKKCVKYYFLKILSVLPLPDISSLESYKLMSTFKKRIWNKLSLPFFNYLSTQLELVTFRCRHEIHIIEEHDRTPNTQELEMKVVEFACKELSKILTVRLFFHNT